MPIYTVDSDIIAEKAATVQGTVGRLQAETTTLQAQLRDLQSSWTGMAAGAFQSSAEEWRAVQLQVEQALAALGESLRAAGMNYADTERAAMSMFR
ncbi:WXG100 family type VII secretion target [Microbacterium sediminis]|uniref:ESAT-6-like protein n=1 Tax=Microbacterium sediminis TaxID=904291 RepID=A0A1B9NBI8_9MICO|nr:WXG100 family type VII secretion target [Microbacterium sediminis]OCG73947.1 type VII secretion protein [Microbacterium sediminis]QBR74700.1 WXG100 family type VII secretion target [Microbacterium sediminis]